MTDESLSTKLWRISSSEGLPCPARLKLHRENRMHKRQIALYAGAFAVLALHLVIPARGRAAQTRAVNDIQVVRNPSPAPSGGASTIRGRTLEVAQSAASVVVDFNGDGASDILWQNQSNGLLSSWRMSGVDRLDGVFLSPNWVADTRWKIVGTPDLNRDGRADILWQHDQGWVAIWFMDGERQISGELLTTSNLSDLGWRIVATGDV